MSKPATKFSSILAVVMLVIGVIAGYAIGYSTAPAPTPGAAATVTVTAPGPTVTVTAPAAGLTGEIRIGALLPLTGVLSTFGAQYKAVAELAEKEINEYLAALGRGWRIKIVAEDTATDPKTCLSKMMTLHGAGIKVFIGVASSAEVSEIKSYADANKLIVISPSSTSPALALKDMILRYTPNDIYQGKAIARIMWLRGIRWVVPVWRGDTWGDGLKDNTIKYFNEICKASGESCGVLEGIRYDPAAKEFSVEAAKLNDIVSSAIAKYGKDKVGVLAISFEEIAALFAAAKAYPALGEVQWQGSDGTAAIEPLLDPAVADFAIKVKFYNTMASPGVSPHTEKIRSYIKEKLGMEPMGYTYFVYDAFWTIALAIDAAGVYDGGKIMQVLPYVLAHYIGASGYIQLDENGDRAIADYDIWAVVPEAGKYVWKVVGLFEGLTESVKWR